MYVLPYGQMSLWGATVITNLMSAIPWVGQDIVEFIWGGLNTVEPYCGDVILKILLNAGKSPNLGVAYDLFFIFIIIYVKIAITRGQSAGVRSLHTSEASQRLHAEDLGTKNLKSLFYSNIIVPYSNQNGEQLSKSPVSLSSISPYYVTGLSDAESSFHVSIIKSQLYKLGFKVIAVYTIQLHIKDIELLNKLKSFFGTGSITIKKDKQGNPLSAVFSVQSLKDLSNVIVPHFDKYPLLSKKRADYLLFKNIVDLMVGGFHLSEEGLKKIISIKASMNKGISSELQQEYPNIIPVKRPDINMDDFPVNIEWLVGFVEGEGSFFCLIRKNSTHLIGYQVTLTFSLNQHIRDLDLMIKIQKYLGFGIVRSERSDTIVTLTVTKRKDLDILISLFKSRNFLGSKDLDFKDFIVIQQLLNNNHHKTEEGLQQIRTIKRNMNLRRIHE